MPDPILDETEKDFLHRCIPQMIHEGYENKRAIGACYGIYRSKGTEAKSPKPEKKNPNNPTNFSYSYNNSKNNKKLLTKKDKLNAYCYLCL